MSRQKFRATLERAANRLNWTLIRVPAKVSKNWGRRGLIRVKGSINGFAFRTSLFPDGKGSHVLVVNKQMQKGSGTCPGSTAQFEIEPDSEEREVVVPPELLKALKQDKALFRYFQALSPSTRREISRVIGQAKQAETRIRRAEETAERLMQVMEAEQDLPPILQVALARDARARIGWERMPPSHRRFHLFGIFHYKQPEAQARRVAKAVEMMIKYAEKPEDRKSRRRGGDFDE
jgi:uncharacterized protein YdeI (YjbR/CyaY-like superfamily)